MQHALKEHEGSDEIEVLEDGSIKSVSNVKECVVSLDSDSDFDEPASKRRRARGIDDAGRSKSAAANTAIVDLTTKDSDTEAPKLAPSPTDATPKSLSQQPRQLQSSPQTANGASPTQAASAVAFSTPRTISPGFWVNSTSCD